MNKKVFEEFFKFNGLLHFNFSIPLSYNPSFDWFAPRLRWNSKWPKRFESQLYLRLKNIICAKSCKHFTIVNYYATHCTDLDNYLPTTMLQFTIIERLYDWSQLVEQIIGQSWKRFTIKHYCVGSFTWWRKPDVFALGYVISSLQNFILLIQQTSLTQKHRV